MNTHDNQLYIRKAKSDTLIAQHPIAKGKDKLTKDPTHGREPEKKLKLEHHILDVLRHFSDKHKATIFIDQLKARYPKHIRDQLRVTTSIVDTYSPVLDQALDECLALKLFSAVELKDVAVDLNRRRMQLDSHSSKRDVLPIHYQTICATERPVASYLNVLGGERP